MEHLAVHVIDELAAVELLRGLHIGPSAGHLERAAGNLLPAHVVHPATVTLQQSPSVAMNARSDGVGSRPSGRRSWTLLFIGSAPSSRKVTSSPRSASSSTTSRETKPMPRPARTERLIASFESSSQRLAGW